MCFTVDLLSPKLRCPKWRLSVPSSSPKALVSPLINLSMYMTLTSKASEHRSAFVEMPHRHFAVRCSI